MEFKDLIYELIVEEVKNKKLLNSLYNKWSREDSSVTPEITEYIFTRFMGGTDDEGNKIKPLKDQLNSLKRPEIISFLQKFNGEGGREKFNPQRLKDIVSYSLSQIKTLFAQFGLKIGIQKKTYFFEDPSREKKDWVEESRKLWYGDQFKIYDDGSGFRVYQPKTQRDAISFGFYQQKLAQENFPSSNKWCVTNYRSDSMSNLWQSYRDRKPASRTFYFVIDETKPADDQFHLSALQVLSQPENGFPYRITNGSNTNHDMLISLNDPQNEDKSLQHIYKQTLAPELLEKLQPVPFIEEKEMDLTVSDLETLLRRIKEDSSSQYDFVIQDPEVKRAYIQRKFEVTTIRSFESLNDSDVRLYFEVQLTPDNNGAVNTQDLFKSYETFVYLLKKRSKSVGDYISQKLKQAGSSVADIVTSLMARTFRDVFVSEKDENIKLLESTTGGKCGIFDARTADWAKKDGIKYTPDYERILSESTLGVFAFDEPKEGEEIDFENYTQYIYEVYSKSGNLNDNTNFHCFGTDQLESSGFFLTQKKWLEIKDNWIEVDEVDYSRNYDKLGDKLDGSGIAQ